jgi:hypothetical protein
MSVKARMVVTSINAENEFFVSVGLVPVYSSDPADPNYTYSQSTPSGQVTLNITNKAAFDEFSVGDLFDIDFTKISVTETVTDVEPAPVEVPVPAEPETAIQGTSTGFATPADELPAAAPEPVAADPEPVAVAPDTVAAPPETVVAPDAPAPVDPAV